MRGMVIGLAALVVVVAFGVHARAGSGGPDLIQCRNAASKVVVGDAYLPEGQDIKEAGVVTCEDKFPNGCAGGCLACVEFQGLNVAQCVDSGGREITVEDD